MNAAELSPPTEAAGASESDHAPSRMVASLNAQLRELYEAFSGKFVGLAAILQENSRLARQLTDNSHKASGGEVVTRCKVLIGMLQQILREVELAGRMIAANNKDMGEILRCVRDMLIPLKNLTALPLHLRIIGVLTRIEGGSLTDRIVDISGLSQEIDRLADEVEARVLNLFEGAEDLSSLLGKRSTTLFEHEKEERARANALGNRVAGLLGPSISSLEDLEAEATGLDERFRQFRRATDSVIVSLQSEDIARQRLEHIQEAFLRAGLALESGRDTAHIGAIFKLQRSQLESTRQLVERALESIHHGLQDLAPVVEDLIAQSLQQARQAELSSRACTNDFALEIPQLLREFQQCSEPVRKVRELVDSICPSVNAMTNGAGALSQVAYSIQLLSMNTSVKTVHLGDQGAPLGILARELQTIIDESAHDTTEVLRGLDSVAKALSRMKHERESTQDLRYFKAVEDGGLGSMLEDSIAEARSCGDGTGAILKTIHEWAEALSRGIAEGAVLAGDAQPILGMFDDRMAQLDDVCAALGCGSAQSDELLSIQSAVDLTDLYSMASERELHDSIFRNGSVAAGVIAQSGSEFGDSVELF